MILALHKQTWSSLKLPNATRNKTKINKSRIRKTIYEINISVYINIKYNLLPSWQTNNKFIIQFFVSGALKKYH